MSDDSHIRIAIVRSRDGHATVCGPNDFKGTLYNDAMDAALSWHIEAGHIVAATHWALVMLPAIGAEDLVAFTQPSAPTLTQEG